MCLKGLNTPNGQLVTHNFSFWIVMSPINKMILTISPMLPILTDDIDKNATIETQLMIFRYTQFLGNCIQYHLRQNKGYQKDQMMNGFYPLKASLSIEITYIFIYLDTDNYISFSLTCFM